MSLIRLTSKHIQFLQKHYDWSKVRPIVEQMVAENTPGPVILNHVKNQFAKKTQTIKTPIKTLQPIIIKHRSKSEATPLFELDNYGFIKNKP